VHAVRFFLPLVLASIVLGLVRFDTGDQRGPDSEVVNHKKADQIEQEPDETNKNVDQRSATSSTQCNVRAANGGAVANGGVVRQEGGTGCVTPPGVKVSYGGDDCQQGETPSGTPFKVAYVAYGGDDRQQGQTSGDTPPVVLKRGREGTETDNETESDNGASGKLRKLDGEEMMDTSD
jgi:hypothetical protein